MLPPEFCGTTRDDTFRGPEQDADVVFLVVVPQQWPPDGRRHALREHPSRHQVRTQLRAVCGTSVIVPFPTVPQQGAAAVSTAETVVDCEHCAAVVRERGYRRVLLESG
ncbi:MULTISPECIES: hypothetical protein [Actinopolyspora]|uniref:Uncharacterized protein n=1 Tax=Actinopolyspora saharensis TaxID=995062 RepID=A0A1H1G1H3_9ACTN|nr:MULTISPECIES: hypothetical protein [Actinopolyspora]NHD16299.1 hypothetical protein [Actinopolyspora sp. BKK2]NHE75838.1 hypothetical protein [Actinopolyspora sp. BKK1]SDR07087.1 hypothetical protein SAMN04489718_3367 [Actinopolyspora saharensis]